MKEPFMTVGIAIKRIGFGLCITLLAFLLGIGAFLLGEQVLTKRYADELSLRLLLDTPTVRAHDSQTAKLYITNNGDKTVILVQPGDGSQRGMRTPSIKWSITKVADSRPIDNSERFGCGNIDPLKWDEVFRLAPGETKEMKTWLSPFREPGNYNVKLIYENQPAREWGGLGLGPHHPIAMWRVQHSTECSLTSNEVLVTVTE